MERRKRHSGSLWDHSLLSAASPYLPALLIRKHRDLPATPTRSSWHFLHMVRGTIWGIQAIFSHSAALCVGMARIWRLCASPSLCPSTCFQISAVFSKQEGAADGKPSSLTWSIAGLSWLLSPFSGLLSSTYHLPWDKVFFSQGIMAFHSQLSHSQGSLHPAGKGTRLQGGSSAASRIWPQPVPPPSTPLCPEILTAVHQQYSSFCLGTCRRMLESNSFRR